MTSLDIVSTFLLIAGFAVMSSGLAASVGAAARVPLALRRFVGLAAPAGGAADNPIWLGVVVFGLFVFAIVFVEVKDLLTVTDSASLALAWSELGIEAAWLVFLAVRRPKRAPLDQSRGPGTTT